MTDKVLCRYFQQGCCRFGSDCQFSHNWTDAASQVCKFYQQGRCAYGERCRYDHVRPEWNGQQRDRQERHAPAPGYVPPHAPRPALDQQFHRGPPPNGAYAGAGGAYGAGAYAGGAGGGGGGEGGGNDWAEYEEYDEYEDYDEWDQAQALAEQASGAWSEGQQLAALEAEWEDGVWGPADDDEEEGAADTAAGTQQQEDGGGATATRPGQEPAAAAGGGAGAGWNLPDSLLDSGDGIDDWDEEVIEAGGRDAADDAEFAVFQPPAAGPEAEGGADGGGADGGAAWQSGRLPAGLAEAAAAAGLGGGGGLGSGLGGGGAEPGQGISSYAQSRGLCGQYLVSGECSKGDACKLTHGAYCETCHKYVLHPEDAEAAEAHLVECGQRAARLAARLASAHVECGICMDKVLSKQPPSARKFGLMACEHPFCLACIRGWRSQESSTGVDVDAAVRTCPICRTGTHFVTPSGTWPATKDEKDKVVAAYKARLASIDCRHYNFGEGHCPFGTSCFYRHVDKEGNPEEPTALRKAANADEQVQILQPVRLSHFLDTAAAGRALRGGRR